MANGGYSGSLFDSSGPNAFKEAVAGVATELGNVVGKFSDMDSKSKSTLQDINTLFDQILNKATQLGNVMGGIAGPGGAGWGPVGGTPRAGGGNGGQPGQNQNGGNWRLPPAPGQDQTDMGNGGDTNGAPGAPGTPTTQGPRGRSFPDMVAPGTTGGGALAFGTAAVGAAQGWAAGNAPAALQGGIVGQQFANYLGGNYQDYMRRPSGGLNYMGQNVPAGMPLSASDYYQALQLGAQSGLFLPPSYGAATSLGAQNRFNAMGSLNFLGKANPGTSMTANTAALGAVFSPASVSSFYGYGFNIRPGGVQANLTDIFNDIWSVSYPGGQPTVDDLQAGLAQGGNLQVNAAALSAGAIVPGTDIWSAFVVYAQGRVGWQNKNPGKALPSSKDIPKAFGLDKGPGAAALKKATSQAQVGTDLAGGQAAAMTTFDNAVAKFNEGVDKFLGIGQGSMGNMIGGRLQWLNQAGVPGLLFGGGGIAGLSPFGSLIGGALNKAFGGPGTITGGGGGGGSIFGQVLGGLGKVMTPGLSILGLGSSGGGGGGAPTQATTNALVTGGAGGTGSSGVSLMSFSSNRDPFGTISAGITAHSSLANVSYTGQHGSTGSSSDTGGSGTGTNANGSSAGTGGSIGPTPAGGYNQTGWATALLTALGAPTTAANIASLVAWTKREGGAGPEWNIPNNKADYNPLNTMMPEAGSINSGNRKPGSGIQAYPDWATGIKATVDTLTQKNGFYTDIVTALLAGGGLGSGHYAGLSKWSDGGYDHLERGSYNVQRTQLALIHAGERVIPAAQNYTAGERYSRLDATGNPAVNGSGITLNFHPKSIQLNIPAGATPTDMDAIARQFVQSLSKPQIIQKVRSS